MFKRRILVWIVLATLGLLISSSVPRVFSTPLADLQLIESDDPLVQRSGTWAYQDTPNASGGGYLYSTDSVNDVLELNFTGTTIDIIYVKHPALGRFSIEVDNTIVRTVNSYSEDSEFGAIATVGYLDDEPHVLRVFPAEGVIAIDAFQAMLPPSQSQSSSVYSNGTMFIPNYGQVDSNVRFHAQGSDNTIYFTDGEVILYTPHYNEIEINPHTMPTELDLDPVALDVVHLQFIDTNTNVSVGGLEPLATKVNFFKGGSSDWHTNIPTYAGLLYEELYTGVNLQYHITDGLLQSTFEISPQANIEDISWVYEEASDVSIDAATGDLLIDIPTDQGVQTYREVVPVAWQLTQQQTQQDVDLEYVIYPEGAVGFQLGSHDPNQAVTIQAPESLLEEEPEQPSLLYSTFLGGSMYETSASIAISPDGFVYVAGITTSADFPLESPYNPSPVGAFVSKMSQDGTSLIFSTYFGGSSANMAYDITVDDAGNVYLTGTTYSNDFPVTDDAFQQVKGNGAPWAGYDAFVTKLSSSGDFLYYSTYLGGGRGPFDYTHADDAGRSIAIDSLGNAYVTGYTKTNLFPTLNPLQAFNLGIGSGGDRQDAFVTKINPSGTGLIYSTFLGGFCLDTGTGIAADNAGNAYIVGLSGIYTGNCDFPLVNPYYSSDGGVAFLTKISPIGQSIIYSTFLADMPVGGDTMAFTGIAVDESQYVYLSGYTTGLNLPVVNAFQSTNQGGKDAFVTTFAPSGTELVYSTYLGGTNDDLAYDLTYAWDGSVYVVGETASVDFPIVNPIAGQETYQGAGDSFLASIDTRDIGVDSVKYATYVGGSLRDLAWDVDTDELGDPYVVGRTWSSDFPLVNPYQDHLAGADDLFIYKDPDGCPITLQEPLAPFTTREFYDMIAGVSVDRSTYPALPTSSDGLLLHAAPIINSPKVSWDPYDIRVIPWLSLTGDLPPELAPTTIHVLKRLAIDANGQVLAPGDSGNVWQVWYQTKYMYNFDSDRDGSDEVTGENAWILAYIKDDDGTTEFKYHTGPDPEPIDCNALPTPPTIVFPYDREGVANYAMIHSRYLDEVFPTGIILSGQRPDPHNPTLQVDVQRFTRDLRHVEGGLRYAEFSYLSSNLTNDIGASGSALFTSENIWMGGLPMTRVNESTECGSALLPVSSSGWRYCFADNIARLWATGNWRFHGYVTGYYSGWILRQIEENGYKPDVIDIQPSNAIQITREDNWPSFAVQDLPKVVVKLAASTIISNPNVFFVPADGSVKSVPDLFAALHHENDSENCIGPISLDCSMNFNYINQGDYMWIKPQDLLQENPRVNISAHGFIVAGWGPITDCSVALHQARMGTLTLVGVYDPLVQTGMVPYIVDYSGTLQTPISRPFYCTKYDEVGTGEGRFGNNGIHDWYFVRFPDYITISPDQLYASFEWAWE